MADHFTPRELTTAEKELLVQHMPEDLLEIETHGFNRRHFLKLVAITGSGVAALSLVTGFTALAQPLPAPLENAVQVTFQVNGVSQDLLVDSRMSLLDALRERLQLTGTKKGCDHGQCGACTVLLDERRVLSCLTLAATCTGKNLTTIEGLAQGSQLHPMQAAFIKHDGFQCGYCTPGQICSAVALLREAQAGEASFVTADVRTIAEPLQLSEREIKERMSGNLCRCSAYPNIVAAILEVHTGQEVPQNWQPRKS